MKADLSYVVGVDAGGSKTLCAVADSAGRVLGLGRAGPGNWQVSGVDGARDSVCASVDSALGAAGVSAAEVRAAYYGMAGADRPADFDRVRELLEPINPWARWSFENDATIALRAEVPAGVGIGVICGSGTNVVGFNAAGERVQIGGFGFAFGDSAGANHIGTFAMRHAWRAVDGRGPATALVPAIERFFGVATLADVIENLYAGSIPWGRLAPLVFAVAEAGDGVARSILIEVGEELALAAGAAWQRLFSPEAASVAAAVAVVAGGSLFQEPSFPLLFDTFRHGLGRRHPGAQVVRLAVPPVLGAVYAALEQLDVKVSEGSAAGYRRSLALLDAREKERMAR
jgi:N-acetylglucosamine kinase-like BadF-type ATPase